MASKLLLITIFIMKLISWVCSFPSWLCVCLASMHFNFTTSTCLLFHVGLLGPNSVRSVRRRSALAKPSDLSYSTLRRPKQDGCTTEIARTLWDLWCVLEEFFCARVRS